MTLVFDARARLEGGPGLHALLVGVSEYPHLPGGSGSLLPQHFGMPEMRQLSSSALSAYRIYQWLLEHQASLAVPLASVRLLLSPARTELAHEPALGNLAHGADLDTFLHEANAWRADASSHRDGQTWFYFAGNGVQRAHTNVVLLLEDFGDLVGGVFRHAVDIDNVFRGMATGSRTPEVAQTQLYFVDVCRSGLEFMRPFESASTSGVFPVELGGADERAAPIFFGTAAGTGYALGKDQTVFSRVLLECLDRDGADLDDVGGQERWVVSVMSLTTALSTKVDDWNQLLGAAQGMGQEFWLGGYALEIGQSSGPGASGASDLAVKVPRSGCA